MLRHYAAAAAAALRGGARHCCTARRCPPLLHCAATASDAVYSLRRCCAVRLQQLLQNSEAWGAAATGLGVAAQLKFEVCTCGDRDVDDVLEC